jgi:hypothetical protein
MHPDRPLKVCSSKRFLQLRFYQCPTDVFHQIKLDWRYCPFLLLFALQKFEDSLFSSESNTESITCPSYKRNYSIIRDTKSFEMSPYARPTLQLRMRQYQDPSRVCKYL